MLNEQTATAYSTRINDLHTYARADGVVINPESESAFDRFIASNPNFRKGELALTDNGNLRASWRDTADSFLGLQFLGGDNIQYVIFTRRDKNQRITRVAGRDTFEGLYRQIRAFNLEKLVQR